MQTKCFTRTRVPEYYALLRAIHAQGALWLMFLYSSLNSPNNRLLESPSGLPARQPSVAEKSYLAGKATTFSPPSEV